jgi:hypothetical protein
MMFRKAKIAYKELYLTDQARQTGQYDAQVE